VNGAVARLEAAHDLSPDEPNTSLNLAIAYQMQGNHDKAIELFEGLLNKPGQDQGELRKNLGITYEAKADALDVKKRELEGDPKADAGQLESLKSDTIQSYKAALENYEQAVNKVKGSAQIQKQIEQIHAKLEHPEGPPQQAAELE
jgi:tetratricopeptide (TPR) repeat protein